MTTPEDKAPGYEDGGVDELAEKVAELVLATSTPALTQYLTNSKSLRSRLESTLKNFPENGISFTTSISYFDKELNKKVTKSKNVSIKTVVNPLTYAWNFEEKYASYIPQNTKILFVGMNPSPASPTGIPFYDETALGGLLKGCQYNAAIPSGMTDNRTSESGKRFYSFMMKEFGNINKFFQHCFVINYSPLVFMNEGGRNVALDGFQESGEKLITDLMAHSDDALKKTIEELKPKLIVGIGGYAFKRVDQIDHGKELVKIRHPSPAADRKGKPSWDEVVREQLEKNQIWLDTVVSAKK